MVKITLYEEYKSNRAKWRDLYKDIFEKEKSYLNFVIIFEVISVILAVLNVILSFLLEYPIEILLSFFILTCSLLMKLFNFMASNKRKIAELGRRTSFYINLIPIAQLHSVLNVLKKNVDGKKVFGDKDWYIQLRDPTIMKQFYFDFYESIFFQIKLMNQYIKKMYENIIMLFIISLGIFIPILIVEDILIRSIIWAIFIILFVFLFDSFFKTMKFRQKTQKINMIYNSLEGLSFLTRPKPDWIIYECLRLQMEYSLILNEIVPVPNKIYIKNKYRYNQEIKKIVKELNEKF